MPVEDLMEAAIRGARATGLSVRPDSEASSYVYLKLAQSLAAGAFDRGYDPLATAFKVGRFAAGNYFRLGVPHPVFGTRAVRDARRRIKEGRPLPGDEALVRPISSTSHPATLAYSREPEPLDALIAREEIEALRLAIESLPPRERFALLSSYGAFGYPRLTNKEIAAEVGCLPNSVWSIRRRATERLAELLA